LPVIPARGRKISSLRPASVTKKQYVIRKSKYSCLPLYPIDFERLHLGIVARRKKKTGTV
jgi:hypothetical protein